MPPIITPDVDPTDATPVLLLDHAPPVIASVKVVEEPEQTFGVPAITAGNGLITTGVVVLQPPSVYVIVAEPAVPPVMLPVDGLMEAMIVLLLPHTPPETASESIVLDPEQIVVVPEIAEGERFTVTTAVL